MERTTENIIYLSWTHHACGSFRAKLVNGKIAEIGLCEAGAGEGIEERCLTSTNEIYLRALHETLGELFAEVDKANEDLGYKFAKVPEPSVASMSDGEIRRGIKEGTLTKT